MIRKDNNRQLNRNLNETRGYYQNMYEKYMKAAKDSRLAGDIVNAEYNLQYAEHYMRLINEKFLAQQTQVPKEESVAETSTLKSEEIPSAFEKKPYRRKIQHINKESE
ncbi:MAG: DUF4167 domain-containing protein [Holosporales bacterium]|jgi:hypothetical protein|nr:DUF4167 domain-containing protein [Holosporales bacterium]